MTIDLMFVAIFLGLEWYYAKRFNHFEKDVLDQLLETNRRLEILIENTEPLQITQQAPQVSRWDAGKAEKEALANRLV